VSVGARAPGVRRHAADEPTAARAPEAPGGGGALHQLLALVEAQVRAAVAARRALDPNPDDAFRGLYLSDEQVDRLLAGGWPPVAAPDAVRAKVRRRVEAVLAAERGEPGSLVHLASRFGLETLDVELLVVALAPDLDSRLERLFGYLNDDVTRRRASVGLALELCGESPMGPGRHHLGPSSPLVAGGLVFLEEPERPFLTRSLRVPDRVAAHLLGDDSPPPELADLLLPAPAPVELDAASLARAIEGGVAFVYLHERPGTAGRALAVEALRVAGLEALNVDLARLGPDADPATVASCLEREARLRGAAIVAGPLEALGERASPRERAAVRAFAELDATVVLVGRGGWDPACSWRVPLVLDAPLPSLPARLGAWQAQLGSSVAPAALEAAVAAFRLAPEQIAQASQAARWHALHADEAVGPAHVRIGALGQNSAGLERLARRVQPAVGFDDLVLPASTRRALEELVGRVRHRELVLGEWGMRPGGARGHGVTALFAGESGTGKTMSAEVVAGALGLELYTINLATVVDKYVGETEKNLEKIFAEVDGVNGVLFFDEADALFGKRSEVRDAHDRYANIEVAYLLQRIETFEGLAILATNLRANVDEAFTRRLDAVVDFPFPDEAQRLELWRRCLGASVPLEPDVDLDFLAASFELSGGNIRSIALTAAYLAAADRRPLSMADVVRAVHREYRKLGRLSVRAEFGKWYDVVASEEELEGAS